MKIHKEGYKICIVTFISLIIINGIAFHLFPKYSFVLSLLLLFSIFIIILLGFFFYKPTRALRFDKNKIYSPADGKIVAIEETNEDEYFKERRIQVSIFMSIWNAHINWSPVEGMIKYYKYHPGKFLIARNPKSSSLNERSSLVIETGPNIQVMVRQIAGMVARRIVTYVTGAGQNFKQGEEFGFIKFGSRVDILLPLNTRVNVKLGDKVRGCKTTIATIIWMHRFFYSIIILNKGLYPFTSPEALYVS